ncbi:unnamed protein product, partial [Rotaria socialis]
MAKSWFSDFFSIVLRLAGVCVGIMFIPCVVVGSMGASNYANNRSFRNAHTHTTCLLLNYTVFKYKCQSCDEDTCTYYTCFDENFEFSYPIFNQTVVRSKFSSIAKKNTHKQTQIGQNYTCYYTTKQVTSVIFELPSIKTPLVQICVSFGLLGLPPIDNKFDYVHNKSANSIKDINSQVEHDHKRPAKIEVHPTKHYELVNDDPDENKSVESNGRRYFENYAFKYMRCCCTCTPLCTLLPLIFFILVMSISAASIIALLLSTRITTTTTITMTTSASTPSASTETIRAVTAATSSATKTTTTTTEKISASVSTTSVITATTTRNATTEMATTKTTTTTTTTKKMTTSVSTTSAIRTATTRKTTRKVTTTTSTATATTTAKLTTDICAPSCNSQQTCIQGYCLDIGHLLCALTWSPSIEVDLVVTTPTGKTMYDITSTDLSYFDGGLFEGYGVDYKELDTVYWPIGGSLPPSGTYYVCSA